MTYEQIVQTVRESLSRRDARRDVLAAKIRDIAVAAMSAARVTEIRCASGHTLALETASATCSQWADGSYAVTGRAKVLVLNRSGAVGTDPTERGDAAGYFDGHNRQRQVGALRVGDVVLHHPTVANLRAVARDLPSAVAQLLTAATERAATEAREAEEAAAQLTTE